LALLFTGCAVIDPLLFPNNKNDEKISCKTIAIIPIEDNREKEKDSTIIQHLSSLLTDQILKRNYDVLNADNSARVLKAKGVSAMNLENASPDELCRLLEVDAILKPTLHSYANEPGSNHSLDIDLQLYNAHGDSVLTNHIRSRSDGQLICCVGLSSMGLFYSAIATVVLGNNYGKSDIYKRGSIWPFIIAFLPPVLYGLFEVIRDFDSATLWEYIHYLPKGQGQGILLTR
jgi:hypothetical protein